MRHFIKKIIVEEIKIGREWLKAKFINYPMCTEGN